VPASRYGAVLRPLPGERRLWRTGLRQWAWQFGSRELMSTPALNPEQRVMAFWLTSMIAVAGFFGWMAPRMLRWLLTGRGGYRPSRETCWPIGSKGIPRALAADLEAIRRNPPPGMESRSDG
jgi:hypothetical protein